MRWKNGSIPCEPPRLFNRKRRHFGATGTVLHMTRLLIVQYGDYYQALQAREQGDPETYRAQYYSLDCVDAVAGDNPCLVICLDTHPFDLEFENYHLVGGGFQPVSRGLFYALDVRRSASRILAMAREFGPTHIIVRTPGWVLQHIGEWAVEKGIHFFPVFADLFYHQGLKNRTRNRRAVQLLNHPHVKMVANHNYPACRSMAAAGVDPAKIVPYDWPQIRSPEASREKTLTRGEGPAKLLFVGQVSAEKGAGDLVEAVHRLRRKGYEVLADFFGEGPDLEGLRALKDRLGLNNRVLFHGLTPNQKVMCSMAAADLVVVPSRHEYPEGLPCVIYESFETRTPLVCSDHPSFIPMLKDGLGCRIFQAGNPDALAEVVGELLDDPEAYAEMSIRTVDAWKAVQCPVTFGEMLEQWMAWTVSGHEAPCLAHSLAHA
jgi:glycosyltransferase involved in cell wall biosynthesis